MTQQRAQVAKWLLVAAFFGTLYAYDAMPRQPGSAHDLWLIASLCGLNICALIIALARHANARAAGYRTRAQQQAWKIPRGDEAAQADARAEALLLESLSEDQRAQLDAWHGFNVMGSKGRKYEINRGSTDVRCWGGGWEGVTFWCIRPFEPVPNADRMLAQKVLLESDERLFRRIANKMR